MAEKGFMDWYMEDVQRSINMHAAIEMSRDKDGKVDANKASGIAMGMGYTSGEDFAHLAGHLGAAGAFDDDRPSSHTVQHTTWEDPQSLSPEERRKRMENYYNSRYSAVASFSGAGILFSWMFLFIMLLADADGSGVCLLIVAVLNAVLAFVIYTAKNNRDENLRRVEKVCAKQKKEEQKKAQQKSEAGSGECWEYYNEEAEDGCIGLNIISSEDLHRLSEAGYDPWDLELMEPEEQRQAMEEAGVDVWQYDFED